MLRFGINLIHDNAHSQTPPVMLRQFKDFDGNYSIIPFSSNELNKLGGSGHDVVVNKLKNFQTYLSIFSTIVKQLSE